MAFGLRGVHAPHRKNTAGMSPVIMDTPKTVTIPTVMHIGAPATAVVKKGDHVDKGTLIAEQNGVVSSPVYSSVSGTVTAVGEILLSSGKTAPAITIEADGENTVAASVVPPVINSREDLINAIRLSGMVGLGGAGFPTYVKFGADKPLEIQELIINGAECEPYITSDSITMVEGAEDIAFALEALIKYLNIEKVIIGIEKNKPDAIGSMKKIAEANDKIEVKVLPSQYPQGGEKVLVYHTTGKKIALGKLPIDVGCVVCNSTTIASIGKYLKTGMPLVEKCITVDGSAVKEPKNIIAPIGASLQSVFEFAGGFKAEPKKVLYGGPMMGITVPSLDAPVIKNTNAVLAFAEKEANAPKTTACIKCGACINHCPFGINPPMIAKGLKENDLELVKKAGAELCMECGCCSFVCPAKRPIVQNNKLAKAALRTAKEVK
ncbi:MAG: electron transport complex subunit RsxC [Ruminococcaceae bacterium]|nr:electron transport complex subunit RsxC [Oscillospiraceae bacterium]